MKARILVTGGTGFIGSHTTVELIEAGFDVVIIDNLSNSQIDVLDGIEKITGIRPAFHQFDLCDTEKTNAFFSQNKDIQGIIHFAALKAVGESVQKPLEYYHNNLTSLLNILTAMRTYNLPNFIFSSSCTVYGQPDVLPVTEKSPVQNATSPYGNTKQICEEIIRATIVAHPLLHAISLRYFNPIGGHPSAHIGELPIGIPLNLVPYVTQTAIGIRNELQVYGNDYNTPDGTCIRDYIHVVDLAKAHVVALKRLLDKKQKKNYEVFNLGTGTGVSVMEVIQTFKKVSGVKLNYKITGRRTGDIEKIWADASFANTELGWKTKSTLAEALLTAWNWEKHIRKK